MPGSNLTRIEAEERKAVIEAPIHYHVDLDLTVGAKNFGSKSLICFNAKPGSSTFLDLIADEVTSIDLNGKSLDPAVAFQDNRIELTDLKEKNEVTVEAKCRYSNTGEGLHRSVDPSDGNIYLYSQFEVPDARRVYAVFDQPDLKATFDFKVLAPASWIVTSNMPVATIEDDPRETLDGTLGDKPNESTRLWDFEPTPVMSSYLTAICAGPYAEWHTEYLNEDGRTVPMAQYCRQSLAKAFAKDVDYLFDITKKGFAFYAKTWGVPYPYAKFDQIYVPEYNAGAMENIGMVTIRDSYVFESKVTDALAERRVVTVLHELAHMWFGDYVTMKWWNDLWLNESFAEFTSTLATAEATEWHDAWATFCSGEKSWALRQDQLPTTHPIVAPINDLNDTYVNFDGITYAKGASVRINTIATGLTVNADGTIAELKLTQSAPAEHPVLRPHRLAVGFYNEDAATGKIVRTEQFELDVDGETTIVEAAAGKPRPAFVLVNDDDLTYTKIRFDAESQAFAEANLHRFDDALARAVTWLAFWDMTRDGEFPAERFVDMTLRLLATETESTTFRYALACMGTTAHHYVAPARRDDVLRHVAAELWTLANAAAAGSDTQFQLATAYLGYGEEGDAAFAANAHGLLDGTVRLEGLEIDNNFTWTIVQALTSVNEMTNDDVDAQLAKKETTENREFAYGARASMATTQAKEWAWDQALHNDELTNSQLEAVARGFSATPRPDLAEPFAAKYFETVDWVWANKTYHMAEALLNGLYPGYADPATLVKLGDAWLDEHIAADNALKRLIVENVASSHRTLKVREYNEAL